MFIYILILLFMLCILLIRNTVLYKDTISKNTIVCFTIVLLYIPYIFRDQNVGTDYHMYNSIFTVPSESLKLSNLEPAYITINSIAQHYNNFLIVPFIIFTIFIIGMLCLTKPFNLNYFTFFAFFVFNYLYILSFNIMRQYSAIGIVSIAVTLYFYFYNHRIVKYLLFILMILFASLFHSTAIFCFVFLLLPKISVTKTKVIIVGFLTFGLVFTDIVRNIVNQLLPYFPEYSQKYSMGLVNSEKGFIQLLPILIQFIFLYIYVKHNDFNYDYKMKFILSGYLFFLFLYSGSGNIILDRLQMYSFIFPLLFSCLFMDNNNISVNNKNSFTHYYKYIFLLFWVIYFLFRLTGNNGGIIPYSFL